MEKIKKSARGDRDSIARAVTEKSARNQFKRINS
jgi:hypothetical protein